MESRITVVQALDERDLLVRRISDQIERVNFVDLVRPRAAVTLEKRMTREGFESQAQGALQKIQALVERYDRLNAAIITSNASAKIETSAGEMTVAFAVALRSRLRGGGPFGDMTDFEGILARKMEKEYREVQEKMRRKNEAVRRASLQAEIRRNAVGVSALVSQSGHTAPVGKMKDRLDGEIRENIKRRDAPGQIAKGAPEHAKGNRMPAVPEPLRVFDPLDICKKAEAMKEEREALLLELDAKIKISNATTWVTV